MTVLPREVRRSGRRSRQAGGRDGGLQEHLIGPVPPPLCRWMADRLPAHDPLLPPHGPLREDKIPSERRRQRRAARGQIPTALGAAPGPTDPAGSGRICPLRTDHLGGIQADHGDAHRAWFLSADPLDPRSGTLRAVGAVHPIWFTDEAVAAWRAEPRTTRGGQPWYSPPAILTALTLRAVFRLGLRQTEGLIGSILRLLGLDLAVPDHTTLSRRAATLEVPRPRPTGGPLHLLVDSTGLRLSGPGEWLVEKHGTKTRRAWRKLHLGVDAGTGRIEAVELTTSEADDGSRVGALLDQLEGAVASFTGDGAYDREDVYDAVAERHPEAAVVVPPRKGAVPSGTAETAPTRRDRHLRLVAEHGRLGWQKASGYNRRALAEAAMSRYKRVIGNALRSRADRRQATEVAIGVHVLNRMLELGDRKSVV